MRHMIIASMAIFIDGGYMANILKNHFKEAPLDYHKFAEWIAGDLNILRVYYYDCLPYQSSDPSQEESKRVSNKQRFFNALTKLPHFEVKQGRLEFRGLNEDGLPIFEQKCVDLLLGIDVTLLATKHRITHAVLVSGDSDLLPVVEVAKAEGVAVTLVHGPKGTYHEQLWMEVDDRKEITKEILKQLAR